MLHKTTVDDFTKLKNVAEEHLHPNGSQVFLFVTFCFSLILTIVPVLAIKLRSNELHSNWSIVANVAIVLIVLQLAATLFFTSINNAYKYQKVLSVVLTLIFFKVSIETYLLYFSTLIVDTPQHFRSLGFTIFLGGFIFLVICTIRAFIRVRSGCYRLNGEMFYDFKKIKTKIFVSIPFIFAAIMITGTMVRHTTSFIELFFDIRGIYSVLLFFLSIQYVLALAIPVFILHTYCKFRFPEFQVQPYTPMKKRNSQFVKRSNIFRSKRPLNALKSRLGRNTFEKAPKWTMFLFIYWSKRPLDVLKSQSGWKTVEKAPKWTMLVVGLELFIFPFLLFVFFAIYGVLRGKMEMAEISGFLINSAILISVIVILLLILLRIVLWIVGKLLMK